MYLRESKAKLLPRWLLVNVVSLIFANKQDLIYNRIGNHNFGRVFIMVNNGYMFEKVRRIILTPHNVHIILKAKIPQFLVPEPDVS